MINIKKRLNILLIFTLLLISLTSTVFGAVDEIFAGESFWQLFSNFTFTSWLVYILLIVAATAFFNDKFGKSGGSALYAFILSFFGISALMFMLFYQGIFPSYFLFLTLEAAVILWGVYTIIGAFTKERNGQKTAGWYRGLMIAIVFLGINATHVFFLDIVESDAEIEGGGLTLVEQIYGPGVQNDSATVVDSLLYRIADNPLTLDFLAKGPVIVIFLFIAAMSWGYHSFENRERTPDSEKKDFRFMGNKEKHPGNTQVSQPQAASGEVKTMERQVNQFLTKFENGKSEPGDREGLRHIMHAINEELYDDDAKRALRQFMGSIDEDSHFDSYGKFIGEMRDSRALWNEFQHMIN